MRNPFGILIFFLFYLFSISSFADETLVLSEGSIKKINIGERHEVTIADPALVKVTSESLDEVNVHALRRGQTVIRFEGPNQAPLSLHIHISSKDIQEIWTRASNQLGDIQGLSVSLHRNQIVLEGKVLTPQDQKRVMLLLKEYPNILNLTEFDKHLWQQTFASVIQKKLEAPGIFVSLKDSQLLLEGQVVDQEESKKIKTRAEALIPINNETPIQVVNLIRVQPMMVHVDLTFMQMNRLEAENAGINIFKTLQSAATLNWDGPGTPQQSLVLKAQAKINQLIREGWAEVLAHPKITVLSGSEDIFHDGGRRFVPGNDSEKTIEINYGIFVKILPRVQMDGSVLMKVTFEVSAPVGGSESLDFSRFHTETEVSCKMGQTLVLSGLASELKNRFQERTPLLSQIPLLKSLFSVETSEKTHKDLILLITPSVPQIEAEVKKGINRFKTLRELVGR